ncbi:MAG: acylphosphatase [Rothia sp. (in: high G+C Gram-positive bacteria)]|nr:acylphosphatase [Rothia sp. (in: high G+C Gram-positive bacteria)]
MGFFDFLLPAKPPAQPVEAQLTATVYGRVQGVGFRWWAAGEAKSLGLVGYAKNMDDGSVEILAQGSKSACEQLLATVKSGDTAGNVENVQADVTEPIGTYKNFGIY